MPRPQTITLHVNGSDHTLDVESDSMLLYPLRDNLGLHGPKFGCCLAECGACTVVMNGTGIRSCMTPVSTRGADVPRAAAEAYGRVSRRSGGKKPEANGKLMHGCGIAWDWDVGSGDVLGTPNPPKR